MYKPLPKIEIQKDDLLLDNVNKVMEVVEKEIEEKGTVTMKMYRRGMLWEILETEHFGGKYHPPKESIIKFVKNRLQNAQRNACAFIRIC